MPEIKKVEIETENPPAPTPTIAESQLAMAVAFGRMEQSNQNLQAELAADKAERSTTTAMLAEALAEIRALKSQTDTTSRHVEQLSESQTDILLAKTEDSEKEDKVIEITPPMETRIEIEQKPAKRPNLLQRLFF